MIRRLSLFCILTIAIRAQNEYEIVDAEDNDLDSVYWEPKIIPPGLKVDLKPHKITDYEKSGLSYVGPEVKVESRPRPNRRIVRKKAENRFSQAEKIELVRLHNLYRTNVTPSAADMEWMQWDEKLAEMAQAWANTCYFAHGLPTKPRYYNKLGQNLYMGWDRAIWRPLYLWYEEFKDYDFHTTYCPPNKQCGHYTTMVWAKSNKIGCAVHSCPPNYYVVCHYHPPGNFQGEKPYKVGIPCTLCGSAADGGLCYENMCVTKDDCKKDNLQCSCNLQCQNCGVLDKSKCACKCKAGWDMLDCSVQCTDESEYCRKNPGFPNKYSCPTNEGRVQHIYCRKMCGECGGSGTGSSNTCCDGKVCSSGYVLDSNCECVLLCPGAKCDEMREQPPKPSSRLEQKLKPPAETQRKPQPPTVSKSKPENEHKPSPPVESERRPWSSYGTEYRPKPPTVNKPVETKQRPTPPSKPESIPWPFEHLYKPKPPTDKNRSPWRYEDNYKPNPPPETERQPWPPSEPIPPTEAEKKPWSPFGTQRKPWAPVGTDRKPWHSAEMDGKPVHPTGSKNKQKHPTETEHPSRKHCKACPSQEWQDEKAAWEVPEGYDDTEDDSSTIKYSKMLISVEFILLSIYCLR